MSCTTSGATPRSSSLSISRSAAFSSIVDPGAYVEPGYPQGIMPTVFANLPKAQLDALVKFLAAGSKQ